MIQSILDSFSDPHSRHALLVHFPIVLGALGLLPVLVLSAKKFSSVLGSSLCVAWFVAATIAFALASDAGEEAYERVEESRPSLTQVEHDALENHESLGEGAWLWALPATILAAGTLLPSKKIRITSGILLIAAAATLTGFVAVVGHTGGTLVYEHGLGVPQRTMPSGAMVDIAGGSTDHHKDSNEDHD